MDREKLRGKVQTVTGLLDPAKLGKTLMHEHLLCDLRTPTMLKSNEPDPEITLQNRYAIDYGRIPHKMQYVMDMKDIAIVEMGNMKEVGGNSLVELTCGGFKPDPRACGTSRSRPASTSSWAAATTSTNTSPTSCAAASPRTSRLR